MRVRLANAVFPEFRNINEFFINDVYERSVDCTSAHISHLPAICEIVRSLGGMQIHIAIHPAYAGLEAAGLKV